ncbi:hypothetical protein NX059_008405 [Plenodomus lindquistii]|nr:hypothetical protein NX059_008405 [Plenodomus lindquistii]
MAAIVDPDSIEVIPQHQQVDTTRHPPSRTSNTTAIPNNGLQVPSQVESTSTSSGRQTAPQSNYFRSRRVKKGEVERPWLDKKDPRAKWVTAFPIIGFLLGLGIAGVLIWDGVRTVAVHKYCEVLNENFSTWNPDIWTKEVEVGGYGNGHFDMTTNTDENVYIQNGQLIIKPTLQDESLLTQNTTLDLRGLGCTAQTWEACVTSTNTTNGTIINPVKSGRINTKRGASIKYGRVEVVAKLPAGDWLWPAIWMLPVDNAYGEWPASGEIDIMESRGNNASYAQGGNNIASSTLHFGPNALNDGWWLNNVKRKALHTNYAAGYNTFGVEWSEKYIFTYINTRLQQVLFTSFAQPFWDYGRFPLSDTNGSRLANPWQNTGSNASPFDQPFYLVINVAVGGTNGWFKDGKAGKPWIDASPRAKKDFWDARAQWGSSWERGGWMAVRSVKMWQQSGWNGCVA